ncbi:MAG: hypothetical protein QQN41_11010 [Nitrosopumilus sp.]
MPDLDFDINSIPTVSLYSNFDLIDVPSYIAPSEYFGSHSEKPLGSSYKLRDTCLYDLTVGAALTYWNDNIATKFNQLASEVEDDCVMVSSPSQIILHKSYQEIIGLGSKVIPFLINRLDSTPSFWFMALEAIAGENPVPMNQRGYLEKEIAAWRDWALAQGYG